eukprot:5738890-Amphidinium_carterae.1
MSPPKRIVDGPTADHKPPQATSKGNETAALSPPKRIGGGQLSTESSVADHKGSTSVLPQTHDEVTELPSAWSGLQSSPSRTGGQQSNQSVVADPKAFTFGPPPVRQQEMSEPSP